MTVAIWIVVVVLLAHWVSDFVFQPAWMSLRKSKEAGVLAWHSARITAGSVVAGVAVNLLASPGYFGATDLIVWAVLQGASHFAIDFITSKITSRLFAKQDFHNFFVVIGFDQFLHTTFALATLAWLAS